MVAGAGWGLRIHTPWFCNKHWQRARSQEGAARGLVPCLRAHLGKFMKKQRGTCPAETSLFIVSYSLKYVLRFQDNTLKLLHKHGENLQSFFQEERCPLLLAALSDILKPNSTILWDFGTRHRSFVFPAGGWSWWLWSFTLNWIDI